METSHKTYHSDNLGSSMMKRARQLAQIRKDLNVELPQPTSKKLTYCPRTIKINQFEVEVRIIKNNYLDEKRFVDIISITPAPQNDELSDIMKQIPNLI